MTSKIDEKEFEEWFKKINEFGDYDGSEREMKISFLASRELLRGKESQELKPRKGFDRSYMSHE
jgi:hypothetical protein